MRNARHQIVSGTFRVWCRGSLNDYHVSLNPAAINLTPVDSASNANNQNDCCCASRLNLSRLRSGKSSSSSGSLEISATELVSVRPATGAPVNSAKFNMGTPLFMIVAYTRNNRSMRTVLYFHLIENAPDPPDLSDVSLIKDEWLRALHRLYFRVPEAPLKALLGRKVLVLLDAFAADDRGLALRVFRERVAPALSDAGLPHEVMLTDHAGSAAADVVRRANLAQWRAVIAVAAAGHVCDRLVAGVVNGLFERADWQDALGHLAVCSVPVGNAAVSVVSDAVMNSSAVDRADSKDALSSRVLNVVSCRSAASPLDLVFVQTKSHSWVGVSGLEWGAMGRALGQVLTRRASPLRLQMSLSQPAALARKLSGMSASTRPVAAVLSYLPVAKTEFHVQPVDLGSDKRSCFTCSTCSASDKSSLEDDDDGDDNCDSLDRLIKPSHSPVSPPPPPSRYCYTSLLTEGQLYFRSWQELDARLRCGGRNINNNNHVSDLGLEKQLSVNNNNGKRPRPFFPAMPEIAQPLPKEQGWHTEVDDFLAVLLLKHVVAAASTVASTLDDGRLWLLVVRASVSRRDLSRFVGSLWQSEWRLAPGIDVVPVRGVRLVPLTDEVVVTVDGADVDSQPVQAFVMPAVARTLIAK